MGYGLSARIGLPVVTTIGVLVLSSCSGGAAEKSSKPAGETTRQSRSESDSAVRVVNLNAAMGYKLEAGNPDGTDATTEDFEDLADDILRQHADIANLQEMAKPAAEELRDILSRQTGHEWQLNWAHSSRASYYEGKEGERDPRPGYKDVSAGNAQLVRIGAGIREQRPITLDGPDSDQGIVLPSGGRSYGGSEIFTENGVIDVYVTHLARASDAPDDLRAADVRKIQELTESRSNPAIIVGDFNQVIDQQPGTIDYTSRETIIALSSFMTMYGYTDVARDQGPTSNQKSRVLGSARIDYILARGVQTRDTVRFESHQSDHWGLATTVDAASGSEVSKAFQGHWRSPAPAVQPTSDKTYWVDITLRAGPVSARVGDVLYPGLECGGALTLIESDPDKLTLTEHIARDPKNTCGKDGTVTLVVTPEGLDYSYVAAGETEVTVTAKLVRA